MKSKLLICAVVLAVAGFLVILITAPRAQAGTVTTTTTTTKVTTVVTKTVSPPAKTQHVDLVLCLDTSNSMDGLITSAKQKLWTIVNELAAANPKPNLRVALYQYGNDSLGKDGGWVQQVCPLTDNLDKIYGELFKLTTNGGIEYVGRVARNALLEQSWSTNDKALKLIVVAGNEPATQDPKHPIKEVCAQAVKKGVVINTIFCGPAQVGRDSGWADVAKFAGGDYVAIDQDSGTVVVTTPYDKRLAELSRELNTTYIAYGAKGKGRAELQKEQDANAAKVGASVAADRAVAKSTTVYRNAGWDVVDAVKDNKIDLAKAPAGMLPGPMKTMTVVERKKYVEEVAGRRAQLQKEIQALGLQRTAYQQKQMKAQGLSEKKSLDLNLRLIIRNQAKKQGMTFEESKPESKTEK